MKPCPPIKTQIDLCTSVAVLLFQQVGPSPEFHLKTLLIQFPVTSTTTSGTKSSVAPLVFRTFDDSLRKIVGNLIWAFRIAAVTVPYFDITFGFTEDICRFSSLRDKDRGEHSEMSHLRSCVLEMSSWQRSVTPFVLVQCEAFWGQR